MNNKIVCQCIFLMSIVAIPAYAQNITIKSVALQPSDNTAIIQPCLDNNGDTCALLKIKTDNLEGIEFSNPNQYIKTTYSDGIYSVYVPELSRKLDFLHKDYMPVQLDMAAYGYRKLRKGKTYIVVLDVPPITDLKSSVLLKIEPRTAIVTFDKKKLDYSDDGTYEIPVKAGTFSYKVEAENYYLKEGTITVGKFEVKTLSVRLIPIVHEVLIRSNVDEARVFVDNIEYGNVGKLLIPQGNHKVRIQAKGYIDEEKEARIDSSTGSLSFILKENKNVTHIHATPVKIYATSNNLYKNNKKIKGWKDGATIMFMPGEYLLSDDLGSTIKLVVGSEPLKVKFSQLGSEITIDETPEANNTSNGSQLKYQPAIFQLYETMQKK